MTSPGNLALFKCSVGLDQLNSGKNPKTLHWKCKCSLEKEGCETLGRSLGWVHCWKLWRYPLSSHPKFWMILRISLWDPSTQGWRSCCHRLAQVTKSQGNMCMEVFVPSNFHSGMKSDRHTQCSRFLQNPTRFAKIRTSFHTPYSHSFYLQSNFYPFISKGELSFAWAFLFFSPVRPPSD